MSDVVSMFREVMEQLEAYRQHSRSGGDESCSDHPDAPHGFNRTASHMEDRLVCDCEGWEPAPWESSVQASFATFFLCQHGRDLLALLETDDRWELTEAGRAMRGGK